MRVLSNQAAMRRRRKHLAERTPRWPRRLSRRELLATFLGVPIALAAGCSNQSSRLPPEGEIVGADADLGHRLRDKPRPAITGQNPLRVGTVIVGAGVAGLAAAWRLHRAGDDDFVVVELEQQSGGTARSGRSSVTAYPWGAHYVPAPLKENRALIALLDDMGVVHGRTPAGDPIIAEQHLCRDPEERLFVDGQWHEGLLPEATLDQQDRDDWRRFQDEVAKLVTWRDGRGRRAFGIPSATASDDGEIAALDSISMAAWLDARTIHSPRVRWLIDYACRDDYGLRTAQTSAWAGLFYFASRVGGPESHAQPLMTWPQGNGRITAHLHESVHAKVTLGAAVTAIVPSTPGAPGDDARQPRVDVLAQRRDGTTMAWRAQRVIFAAPQFVAPYVIEGFREARAAGAAAASSTSADFTYGSWLVANLHLSARPQQRGFEMAWDNVIYDSPGLGYVVATHQTGRDHGPTVITYYLPLCDDDPRQARGRLYDLTWSEAADLVLTDLQTAHPEIRSLVSRLDVMRWGHAMIRPTPGFQFGAARRAALAPFRGVHFAHSDLSGLPLFEEAFDRCLRAAEETMTARQVRFQTMM